MSILDTFYIVFKNMGGKELNKVQEDLKKSTDAVYSSFKNSDKQIQESDKGFSVLAASADGLRKELFSLGTAALSAYSIVHQLGNALSFNINLDRASRSLSVNIQDLDAWESAVMRNGGTAEGFVASLKSLTENLNITGDTALKILPQLADAFQKLGPITAMRYGHSLGLDDSTILTLMQGKDAVEKLIQKQRELGNTTAEDAKKAREFSYALNDLNTASRNSFTQMESGILPALTKAAEILTTLSVRANNIRIYGDLGLTDFSKNLTKTFELLYKYFEQRLPDFGKLFENEFQKIENTFSKRLGGLEHKLTVEFPFLKKLGLDKDTKNNPTETKESNFNIGFPDDIKSALALSQKTMHEIDNNPLLSQTSNSINNNISNSYFDKKGGNKSLQLNTGPITIQTQATDANGIADAFNRTLEDHLKQVNNYFDDGIQI